jgi:hypothetical protein
LVRHDNATVHLAAGERFQSQQRTYGGLGATVCSTAVLENDMAIKTGSGRSMLAYGGWTEDYERAKREAAALIYEEFQEQRNQQSGEVSNVVGGSLDGATIPEGTRDGQQYQWNAKLQRWVYVR